jgi:hypothetical protein
MRSQTPAAGVTMGYIAVLDVLGFTALVFGDTARAERLQHYLGCLKAAT